MDDLHARLKAAVEERLEVARAACHDSQGHWTAPYDGEHGLIYDDAGNVVTYDEGAPREEQAAHIVANDPATVIRMCERDLRVLERHTSMVLKSWEVAPSGALVGCEHCELTSNDGDLLRRAWPCLEITDMATAYGIAGEGGGG